MINTPFMFAIAKLNNPFILILTQQGEEQAMTADRAEYLAGYLAGTGAVPIRVYYANHEPHYARGLQAGFAAAWCGVDLSACV